MKLTDLNCHNLDLNYQYEHVVVVVAVVASLLVMGCIAFHLLAWFRL